MKGLQVGVGPGTLAWWEAATVWALGRVFPATAAAATTAMARIRMASFISYASKGL